MGRMLGSHGSDQLDRPDLNKCPDCGCFFETNECPLCGKVCPEEFRAGNRKAVKPPKRKKGGSERVVFMDWYYSWWFIILMMIFAPIVGIILFASSPRKTWVKITFAVLAIVFYLMPYILFFITWILSFITG